MGPGRPSLHAFRVGSSLPFPNRPRVGLLFDFLNGLGMLFLGYFFIVKSLFELFDALAETTPHLWQALGPKEQEYYHEKKYEVRG